MDMDEEKRSDQVSEQQQDDLTPEEAKVEEEDKSRETETPATVDIMSDELPKEEGDVRISAAEDMYEEMCLEAMNLFRGNRGLPTVPTRRDLDFYDFRIRKKEDVLKIARERNLRIEKTEASKSFAAAASARLLNSLPGRTLGGTHAAALPAAVGETRMLEQGGARGPVSSSLAAVGYAEIESKGIPRSRASDQLAHLLFSRAVRPPEPQWHPKWKLKTVLSGHTGWVRCLAVDPSNAWFASAGADRLIKIWDLASGTLKLSLTGHVHIIRAIAISERHPYLFSCGEDNTVKCWDLEANKVVRHYHGHLSGVYSLALHPKLDILATGGRDSAVRVWDMRTREEIYTLSGHSSTVFSLAMQSAEPQLISGSADQSIRCWDLKSGGTTTVLTHHAKGVRALAVHPKLYAFVSAAADAVKIWNGPHANYERDLNPCKDILNSIAIKSDPESAVVVAGSDSGHLHFWDWQSGQRFQTIESQPQPGSLSSENAIFAVCFDRSETRLITGEGDKTIKIWEEDATDEYDSAEPSDTAKMLL
eukprot:Gregarina_sp_Pseudo_9__100@NODE_1066_length_1909_cov_9_963636_g998_i0_p1_GENE_NODE_1066_length_1909_cov_9_963636_g998_i0NODE_1066_length_1909_cov_9_963636_g998_i0_p1_ORF_typecomplete_len534_score140_99WD40/PF00400_32/1_2e11WD40/PF00400_32/2_1e07WD40/PF00400_32/7_7e10WD40/PF00400_32/1_9e08WD40/PF00400_32/0_11WD40/PF00400_32/3_8WD40/PF00400_32/0_0015ANAPC4_WD40/PF12894_7/3_5e06ANAPC4_WD40/PF12894_7/2e05ANAPC4_WD40/PF12894_7/2_3e13ANAPC4_WD40/PF12894_7/1_4e12ANAPC4_WD40/PF12894_7/0_12ANAPC4_WD40/PF